MKLKEKGHRVSSVKKFDLLGNDEIGLSKALAYTLAHNRNSLFELLHYLGIKKKNTLKNFERIIIEIEKERTEGRTDIEIKMENKFHIIIESKVKKNKVTKQRTQYLNSFDDKVRKKVMCFITKVRNTNKEIQKGIDIINLDWFELIELFNTNKLTKSNVVKEFLEFTTRSYKMNELREILIQDLSDENEIKRFKEFHVYRRDITFGSPLYFAPYFTRRAKQKEGVGIAYLSKVLGVLTLKPKDIIYFESDLLRFANKDQSIVDTWKDGVLLTDEKTENFYTFYFLGEPLKLNKNLLKDGTKKKGRGKNWIAAMIPKNRSVTFEEFVKRINMAYKKN